MLKIISTQDESQRNAITKATNSQTPVPPVSLRATDRIHFDIQDALARYGLFYDRRKGECKHNRKPRSKTISIQGLAQSVIAILLMKPSEARARPKQYLESNYDKVFINGINCKFYAACVLLDKQASEYMARTDVPREVRTRIRYYLSMVVACELLKTSRPTVAQITEAADLFKNKIDDKILSEWYELVKFEYQQLGGNDNVSKGPQLTANIIEILKIKFPTSTQTTPT